MPEMNPAIIIGLGGTGKEVLMLLRKKVMQSFGSLQNFPLLGYLHLDTDQSQESQAMPSTQYLGEDIALVESERLLLTVTGGNSWKDNQAIRDWFPASLNIPSNFQMGCAAQRNFGRLAFSANVDTIRHRLMTLAPRVTANQTLMDFASRHGVTVVPRLDVFIVSALLGGTGSGMVFDLCYTARHVLKGLQTFFYGYLITGGPTATDDQKANCYAALMELDYYNQQGFQMRYPGTILPQLESHDQPVDWMYLGNGINAMGVPCPREVVWESVAENIFAEIVPGLKDRRKSVRDNIRDAGYGERDRLGKPQCYLSFGMASIETPALNLQDALSYRLAADVLAHWPFTQAPQEDHVRLVDTDIEAWRLKPEQLEDDLVKDDAGIAQLQRIQAKTADQKAEAEPLLDKRRREDLKLMVETHLRNNDTDVERRPALAQSGARMRQLDHRRQLILQDVTRARLFPRVVALVTNAQSGGVSNAQGYLDALEQHLSQHTNEHQMREDQYRRAAGEAYDRKQRLYQVFRDELRESTYVLKRHVDALLDASTHYQQAQVRYTANEMARCLLAGRQSATGGWQERGLLAELRDLRNSIGQYAGVLGELGKRCRNQYERRLASITGSAGLADVMITEEEIAHIYHQAVPDPLHLAITLKNEVEAVLSQNLFSAVLEAPEQTLDALVRAAKEKLSGVRETSIADKLGRLAPAERDNKIQTANRNAHVLIQIDSERRQRYGVITAPENTQILLIGTPPPETSSALVPGGALRRAIENQVPILPQNLVSLPDRYRLLLAYEMGVFSLQCVRDFADYRQIYKTAQARHRHTHQGIAFPDLFPPEEATVLHRAERAAVLGRALEFFGQETDPITHDQAIYYHYEDRHGRHPVQLGRDWHAVEAHLFTGQKEKEILALVDQQEVTPLERVEQDIAQRGKHTTTRPQKEDLWHLLHHYLDDRARALDGGSKHPRHQLESQLINTYRDAYDLTPPPDDALAEPSLPLPPGEGRGEGPSPQSGIERFRQHVHHALTASELSEEQQMDLLATGVVDFDLDHDEAERVLQQVERELVSPVALSENMQHYRAACERLYERSEGALTARDRAYLQALQKRLWLTEQQVQAGEASNTKGGNAP